MSLDMKAIMNDPQEREIMKEMWQSQTGRSFLPELGQSVRWDAQRAVFKQPSVSRLEAAIDRLKVGTTGDPGLEMVLQTDRTGDAGWEGVFQDVHSYRKTHGLPTRMDKLLGRWNLTTEELAACLNGLTDLIPDEKGLSVLRWGLSIVFSNWEIKIKTKNIVLQQLDDIPEVLSGCLKRYQQIRDHELKIAVWDLFGEIINCLAEMIEVMSGYANQNRHMIMRTIQRVPAIKADRIDDIVDRVRRSKARVYEQFEYCERQRMFDGSKASMETRDEVKAIRPVVHNVAAEVRDLRELYQTIARFSRKAFEGIDDLQEQMKKFEERRDLTRVEEIVNTVLQFQAEQTAEKENNRFSLDRHSNVRDRSDVMKELKAVLGSFDLLDDVESIFRDSHYIDPEALREASAVATTSEFRNWLHVAGGKLLLVDGVNSDAKEGYTTPASAFCASFANELAAAGVGLVLQFYCARHLDPKDHSFGPCGLLSGLITQLLFWGPDLSLDFVDMHMLAAVQRFRIEALVGLLFDLLRNVDPSTPVFIIIDGISAYEDNMYDQDKELSYVFEALRSFTSERRDSSLKILLTSTHQSTRLSNTLADEQCVSSGSGIFGIGETFGSLV